MEDEHNIMDTGTTRIVYDPEHDGFFVQQGEEVNDDPECPVDGSIFLSLPQLMQIYGIIQHSDFINAMQMARRSYSERHFH